MSHSAGQNTEPSGSPPSLVTPVDQFGSGAAPASLPIHRAGFDDTP